MQPAVDALFCFQFFSLQRFLQLFAIFSNDELSLNNQILH